MLELKNITKIYRTGNTETKALNGISVAFREKEFVAILGASGSGKTTCLNVIGGLDRYDSGDLIIKGKKTKDFTDKDWDAYRNNSVGFVFQSYNLIMHLSIVANVEMGMTLSGVSKEEKHKRAIEVLKQVGLGDHIGKKPNQLSGGQMQRVAIARALANDPEILLCDEPTGALDTNTSVQIMDLIKEVAKDRLVIMVTHNPELAEKYADRIIRFSDGQIVDDTHPHKERPKSDGFSLRHTAMKFTTALGLSMNNIRTKKGRTFLTAFASSIGIIGIAVILSLSNGFQIQIDEMERTTLAQMPITISQTAVQIDEETLNELQSEMQDSMTGNTEYADTDEIILYDSTENTLLHTNIFTEDFLDYVENVSSDDCSNIGYTRITGMNLLRSTDSGIIPVSFSSSGSDSSSSLLTGISSYPKQLDESDGSYLEQHDARLAGSYPTETTDIVLVIDSDNELDCQILNAMGFDTEGDETIKFDEVVGTEFRLINNNDYYEQTEYGTYMPSMDYEAMYNSDSSITLRICGIIREKEDAPIALLSSGIAYSDELTQLVVDENYESDIVKAQRESNFNVITTEEVDEETKTQLIAYLGGDSTPYVIMLYPKDFETKDNILSYLDSYNLNKSDEDTIVYTDLAGTMSELSGGIMDGITIVLIAFAGISLVTSMIMIGIITYTSVLERTKEIGILKALGARKRDITRVFDAETCILGVFSGTLGVVIAWLLTFPINSLLYNLTELEGVAKLQLSHAVILVAISTILTMIGGHIPPKIAAKNDSVEALR
ncbi:MAG: ABC transporter ATP-binding protein/permease, partial [Ruminococcus sp.]|nr:ABC transporter ATP-binding protein/permease [Ruminococcus sp.]